MSGGPHISCEISAHRRPLAVALARIVRTCAQDIGQKITVRTHTTPSDGHRAKAPVLTLHLSAELAAAQHPVWCLACRLACFCPAARVSVLVHGEDSFRAAAATPALAPAATTRRLRAAG